MSTNKPIKCVSKEYNKEPFFLLQSNGSDKRYVVSFQQKDKIRSFILDFISRSHGELQLKVRDLNDPDQPRDFEGASSKTALLTLIDKYDGVVFHDGCNELIIRNPESGDYIAFDEHGLVFIYTQADYSNDLGRYDIKYKPKEKLIYQFDHWHYRPGNAKEDLASFIGELGLH